MTTTDATIETDLLPRLRRCTGPLHDDIEALLRLEAPMPLMRYGRILRGFHEFLQLWEPRVRQALPERLHPWFDARVRSPFAARDLTALALPEDGTDDAMRASALAAQHGLRLDSPAAAIGSLYVIEGSALGGQVLTPKLLAAHGLTPSTARPTSTASAPGPARCGGSSASSPRPRPALRKPTAPSPATRRWTPSAR
ncbi:biliverdin-producing heme oxygenase [Roseateles chitinivorans]|uniref:biliverdin-producing heme oxygenase n=1 Tax=Roseateles chitinivorans TaxID=2917965 RepID=UPI003D6707E7